MRLLWVAALVLPAFGARAGVVFTTLHSFGVFTTNGANPNAGLVQGADGNFYGTTSSGGANNAGTVFEISINGMLSSLYSFSDGNNGGYPNGLTPGRDGYFYGTTSGGGSNGYGTVFKLTTNGALTTLYMFGAVTSASGDPLDGSIPVAALVQGRDGDFYGTTEYGGASNSGAIFKITTNGALTSLYSFTGGNDGAKPQAGLALGGDGNFYGTTFVSGSNGYGTVFKLTTNGALTTLHAFGAVINASGDRLDGSNPMSGLVQGRDGDFYGTTEYGGANAAGTVFKITTNGALTGLYSFNGTNDGAFPIGALVELGNGDFYGTISDGGYQGDGAVFKITTNGTLTTLYDFGKVTSAYSDSPDGANPQAGLALGLDGNFYGTTFFGGTNDFGTVFKITTNGALTSLYSFTGGNAGSVPNAKLVQGGDGNFYGTTFGGGQYNTFGTVFRISTNGTLTPLYFFTGYNDGATPEGGLTQGSNAIFYGTTYGGGSNFFGTAFKLTTNGALTTLHTFGTVTNYNDSVLDGTYPEAGLVLDKKGNLYGTAAGGGLNGYGTVFKLETNGTLTAYAFGSVTDTNGDPIDGSTPVAGLVQGRDGDFYGTTSSGGANGSGVVFKITTNGALTTLYSFGGVIDTNGDVLDGTDPMAGLTQGSDGDFYGTTYLGGANGLGTIFKITTNGMLATLYAFGAIFDTNGQQQDGSNPMAALAQGSNGNFYGTTYFGGAIGLGTVFKMTPEGALTTLYSFGTITNASGRPLDGANPQAALTQGTDGGFYGTTSSGGPGAGGTVFRLTEALAAPVFQTVTLIGGTLGLTWTTEMGGRYQLQYNSELSAGNWNNLGVVITAAGATLSTTDTLTNGLRRFYRVARLP